jgi:hypothetical protein
MYNTIDTVMSYLFLTSILLNMGFTVAFYVAYKNRGK